MQTDYKALRKLMVDRNIKSAAELGRLAGVSQPTINRVLNGTIQPSRIVIQKLTDALQVDHEEAIAIFFNSDLHKTQG